jgi:hypothetical protein
VGLLRGGDHFVHLSANENILSFIQLFDTEVGPPGFFRASLFTAYVVSASRHEAPIVTGTGVLVAFGLLLLLISFRLEARNSGLSDRRLCVCRSCNHLVPKWSLAKTHEHSERWTVSRECPGSMVNRSGARHYLRSLTTTGGLPVGLGHWGLGHLGRVSRQSGLFLRTCGFIGRSVPSPWFSRHYCLAPVQKIRYTSEVPTCAKGHQLSCGSSGPELGRGSQVTIT